MEISEDWVVATGLALFGRCWLHFGGFSPRFWTKEPLSGPSNARLAAFRADATHHCCVVACCGVHGEESLLAWSVGGVEQLAIQGCLEEGSMNLATAQLKQGR